MLSAQENERLTRVGRGTPMGEFLRRFWLPALLSDELPERDGDPIRTRTLGEDLVAFRDSMHLVEQSPLKRFGISHFVVARKK